MYTLLLQSFLDIFGDAKSTTHPEFSQPLSLGLSYLSSRDTGSYFMVFEYQNNTTWQ
jgi:hypothetical protein